MDKMKELKINKKSVLYFLIFITFIYFVSANGNCTVNWECTNWSECLGNTQIRSCIDTNSCGNDSTKPFENQSCVIIPSCTPDWDCTDWDPKKCPKNRIQERNCTNTNDCESATPPEIKLCTYQSDFSWLFKIIVGIIILTIVFIARLIIKLVKNKQNTAKPL